MVKYSTTMTKVLMIAISTVIGCCSAATPTEWSNVDSKSGSVKYSMLGLFNNASGVPQSQIAKVVKPAGNPLFVQDKIWEPRLDNGYPNVVVDEVDSKPRWQLWYGGCINGGCRDQILMYANSTDGINWDKPNLGKYDLGIKFPSLKKYGKNNNIVMNGGGLGMFKDVHETDPTKLYKISGGSPAGCYGADGNSNCAVATAASPDGIHDWTDVQSLTFPKPWRPDCHTNIVYDERQEAYLMTTRDYINPEGRDISIATSGSSKHWTGNWTLMYKNEYPPTSEAGSKGCSKLGTVDPVGECGAKCRSTTDCAFFWVYTTEKAAGNCCLKSAIEPGAMMKPACLTCGGEFYKMDGNPSRINSTAFGKWADPVLVESGDTDHQLYSQITFPFYNIYLGIVMVFDATDGTVGPNAGHVHCRLSYSTDTIHWDWVDAGGFNGKEFIPAGVQGSFDSHVCFAAHLPIRTSAGADLYYMGGNGPHSGARNSSFAIARLTGVDRFGGVGNGVGTTKMINVTGNLMTITMDVTGASGSVKIAIAGQSDKTSGSLTANVTDAQVCWTAANTLEPLVGKAVAFQFDISDAVVYTIGFESGPSPPPCH